MQSSVKSTAVNSQSETFTSGHSQLSVAPETRLCLRRKAKPRTAQLRPFTTKCYSSQLDTSFTNIFISSSYQSFITGAFFEQLGRELFEPHSLKVFVWAHCKPK